MSYEIGSEWRRWDLHFHTPASYDYDDKSLTPAAIVDALVAAEVGVVAVTDHHTLEERWITSLRDEAADRLTVLPGIELTGDLGGKQAVHFIGLFPEDADIPFISTEIASRTGLSEKRRSGVPDEKLYVEFRAASKTIRDLGGLVTIHAHGKTSSIEDIANKPMFKEKLKEDLLREHVDIIEIGNGKRQDDYWTIVFPDMGFERPLIVGSDNHDAKAYTTRTNCWIKGDPTFRGLRMAIREPRRRFFLGDQPRQLDRVKQNGTKYLRGVRFTQKQELPAGEKWFDDKLIELNPGLVAVIGKKGSGKSALTDCLGLLGSCKTFASFSFLDGKHFRDPKTGRAGQFEASIEWRDGEERTRLLSANIESDEVERVKYLPQKHVEDICNELTASTGGRFEQELKKVIFSHVPIGERLGENSLDDLIRFKTHELQTKAEAQASQLLELCTQRADLERRLDPSVRRALKNSIEVRKREIENHESAKPKPVKAPALDPAAGAAKARLDEVEKRRNDREGLAANVKRHEQIAAAAQLRGARAQKLIQKLDNVEAGIQEEIGDLEPEATQLDLVAAELVTYAINRSPVEGIDKDGGNKRRVANAKLDEKPNGLRARLRAAETALRTAQEELDRPDREHQEHLESLIVWQTKRRALVGDSDDPESLQGLEARLAALNEVPAKIEAVEEKQSAIAAKIHSCRTAEVDVYRTLYQPVQDFIDDQPLAKDKLKLEFQAEIVEEDFVDGLLSQLNQNRKGSFYGAEDGREYANSLVETVDWSSAKAVDQFLLHVERAMQHDQREKQAKRAIKDQIKKGSTVADVLAWVYGLSYLKPRYLLRWEGKDVGQLSAGERGTLLLVFYLLIDKSDTPLIIDQPEANLDNETIAQKLVDCIRAASDRRQLIIVTHNPNLAVVCDADQIIHSKLDISDGNRITYTTGALENPVMNKFAINVLEGSRLAFDKRGDTYEVGDR